MQKSVFGDRIDAMYASACPGGPGTPGSRPAVVDQHDPRLKPGGSAARELHELIQQMRELFAGWRFELLRQPGPTVA